MTVVGYKHSRGFTLVELLASMTIGSMILLAAAAILRSSGDGYERVGSGVSTEREARALMTQLASDLSTARFHKQQINDQSTTTWSADHLGFLSLQPTEAQTDAGHIGDLCAVNYYIHDLTVNGRTTRCLMRGFRESKDTFDALKNDTVATLFSEQENKDEPVAFGVVSFSAKPMKRDATGSWIEWTTNDLTGPEAFDVRLIIARRGLAGRLKQKSDWESSKALGNSADAEKNKDLEIFSALMRFGNDENR